MWIIALAIFLFFLFIWAFIYGANREDKEEEYYNERNEKRKQFESNLQQYKNVVNKHFPEHFKDE